MLTKIKNKTAGLIHRVKLYSYALPRQAAYKLSYTRKIALYNTLTPDEKKLLESLWYHDFSVLGIKTVQEPGIWGPNQQCKEKPIFKFIDRAVRYCHEKKLSAKGAELFCADGFYANYAIKAGAEAMYGVDLNDRDLAKARLISKLLGNSEKTRFEKCDVFDLGGNYGWGICAGGLYHISDPAKLLKSLTGKINNTLVIQTVYSLANDSKDYFETPAPGWTWGCRFSFAYLERMITDAGWEILDSSKNELTGNKRPEDRGSAYFLCLNKKASRG